jgi:hypothetical protein
MIPKLLIPLYEWTYFTLTDGPKPISRMMFWIDDVLQKIEQRIYGLESWDQWEIRMIEELSEEDTDDCTIWTPTDES